MNSHIPAEPKNTLKIFKKKGQTVLEILVAMSIFSLGIAALAFLLIDVVVAHRLGDERARALALAEEGIEAIRSIRDNSFDILTPGTYGLELSGGKWILSGTQDFTGAFVRSVTITIPSANRADVTVDVSWSFTPQRQEKISLFSRFTKWR